MRPTLFIIPHQWLGVPVFGFGWALLFLLLGMGVQFVLARRRGDQAGRVIREQWLFWVAVAAVIVFVLPRVELTLPDGTPLGIAVRGYGMFLALAAIGSVGLAAWRAQRAGDALAAKHAAGKVDLGPDRRGLSADAILQVAPWTFLSGIIGARLFYVIQYFGDFQRDSWGETLRAFTAVTEGGLVVYGGLIGGGLMTAWFVWRRDWDVWKLGDVIIPCVFVGLFFGRLGCLMNGCCFGGACDPGFLAAEFPAGSPVYRRQMLDGRLIGLTGLPTTSNDDPNEHVAEKKWLIQDVRPGSPAAKLGLKPGEEVELILDGSRAVPDPHRPATSVLPSLAILRDGRLLAQIPPEALPSRARPVRATQIISAMSAAMMLLLLLLLERGLRHWPVVARDSEAAQAAKRPPDSGPLGQSDDGSGLDSTMEPHLETTIESISGQRASGANARWQRSGMLLCLGIIAYAAMRIFLEWVRVDEAGQFGTGLSISQLVSLVLIVLSVLMLGVRLSDRFAAADQV